MNTPIQNQVEKLLISSGLNISQLAEDITKSEGRTIHRQQIQRWLDGSGITTENMAMLNRYEAKLAKRKAKINVQPAAQKTKARKR